MNQNTPEILLVEDNLDDANLAIRALRKNEICNSLLHVSDGEEALDYLFCEGRYAERCTSDLPKLILLDLKMPKVDGLEILKRIKNDNRTQSVPVVILTSSNQNADIIQCFKYGANSYVVKPVDFENFVHTVAGIGRYWLQLNQIIQKDI